ncbi:MAG TPA: hypothetical protein VL357_09245 [Rariglobus sp.]|jgi:hypothetical protein|nr:hypothetical protein [Rariglobus sp.]
MSLPAHTRPWPILAWMIAGLLLIAAAWVVPVNLKSVTPPLLKAAGAGTPSVARLGRELLDSEKPGPAALTLVAARAVGDPQADALGTALDRTMQRRPELVPWGGWDPFLDPLFNLKENAGHHESTPVLTFFITEKARVNLRDYLANSRSDGVQSLLRLRTLDHTGRFVPANQPGGQTLDAVILLGALLYQGEHFSSPLQRELRGLADSAIDRKNLGDLEPVFIDLLSLGRRLNWIQLCELLRVTDSTKAIGEFAQLARATPDDLPLIYSAALLSDSADGVATYLLRYGRTGVDDLKLALSFGQGAVNQLLLRQVPVNHQSALSFGPATLLALLYPKLALAVKYLGFLLGAFCLFRGLDRVLFDPSSDDATHPHVKSGVLALLTAGMLILATEPFLLKSAPPSEFQLKLTIPVLSNLSDPSSLTHVDNTFTMDTSTLLSIGFFALLQVGMYLLCLAKMREIDRQDVTALLKLRLMENEENLFDGGLYIGIAGTATALVLQVLHLIDPNLLAAYSSNLFGITCVALVKIRHVRPFKRRLILESQSAEIVKPVAAA